MVHFSIPMIIGSFVFSFMRIHGSKGEIFQALAHVWVATILGYAIGLFVTRRCYSNNKAHFDQERDVATLCFSVLCVVEVACFFIVK
jgi:hypothetical protein